MSKQRNPESYTLAEIKVIAEKAFPPPWSTFESLARLAEFIKSYQEVRRKIRLHGAEPERKSR